MLSSRSQSFLAEQILAQHATAVMFDTSMSANNSQQQQHIFEEVSQVFQGRLQTLTDVNASTNGQGEKKSSSNSSLEDRVLHFLQLSENPDGDEQHTTAKVPFYVFLLLPSKEYDADSQEEHIDMTERALQRTGHPGCALLLCSGSSCEQRFQSVSTELLEKLETVSAKHLSWTTMMSDDLMDDPEYQEEIFGAVVEELSMISSIRLPFNYNNELNKSTSHHHFDYPYLNRVWKLSHSYKTTGTLVGGVLLEARADALCGMLRPVVQRKVDEQTLDHEQVYSAITQFLAAAATLRFMVCVLQQM